LTTLSGLFGEVSPVLAAPMAGGPTTLALVPAVAATGHFAFLAAGYKSADLLAEQIAAGPTDRFGVNLFAPNPIPVDAARYRQYADALAPVADRYRAMLPAGPPREDDDHWTDKIDVLLAVPVRVVSFTFALPPANVIAALRRAGTGLVQTVTSVGEAQAASAAGLDALAVQSAAAGGHYGTFTPGQASSPASLGDLVRAIRRRRGGHGCRRRGGPHGRRRRGHGRNGPAQGR
jgi:nitronate monooxygenase